MPESFDAPEMGQHDRQKLSGLHSLFVIVIGKIGRYCASGNKWPFVFLCRKRTDCR